MKKEFTLTIYTENQVGLINKIAIMFSRRKISLESFNTSPSEVPNIYRFTIVVIESEAVVKIWSNKLKKLWMYLKSIATQMKKLFGNKWPCIKFQQK